MHVDFDDEIIRLMELKYEDRFILDSNSPLMNFFINETHMKVIRHSKYQFLMEQNFMLTFPFDRIHTDILKMQKIIKRFPRFVFPISKNHSIILTNNALLKQLMLEK